MAKNNKSNSKKHKNIMEKKEKSDNMDSIGYKSTPEDIKTKKSIKEIFSAKNVIEGVFIAVLAAIIIAIITLLVNLKSIPTDISLIKKDIESLSNANKEISDDIEELKINYKGIEKDVEFINNRINNLENLHSLASNTIKLEPEEALVNSITIEKHTVDNEEILSTPQWNETEIIAKGMFKEYIAQDLVGKKLLIPYYNNGQEVYFYGQFNENNQWNDNCVINIYKDNKLIFIMDAVYDSGIIKTYKQVMPSKTKYGADIWIISERTTNNGTNLGDTWNYIYEKDYLKSFDFDTVTDNDILVVDDFKLNIRSQLEGYYHGNTSNGVYNDDTGNAYLVKYAPDQTIRTLYCGNFKNGYFEDNTNNAWSITRDVDKNSNYMYYKGKFKDGNRVYNKGHKRKSNLTLEDINTYITGRVFNTELNWAETQSMK